MRSPDDALALAVGALSVLILLSVGLALGDALSPAVGALLGGLAAVAILGGVGLALARAEAPVWHRALAASALALVAILAASRPHVALAEPFYHIRDQVVYTVSALDIARTGSLVTDAPEIFSYQGWKTVTDAPHLHTAQFLPGYATFLALFAGTGGITGIAVANALLLVLTLALVWRLGHHLAGPGGALMALALAATGYATWWFGKGVWSENLQAPLNLGAIVLVAASWATGRTRHLAAAALPLAALVVTRVEAPLYIVTAALAAAPLLWGALRGRRPTRRALTAGGGLALAAAGALVAGRLLLARYLGTIQSDYYASTSGAGESVLRRLAEGARFFALWMGSAVGLAPEPGTRFLGTRLVFRYAYDSLLLQGVVATALAALLALALARGRRVHLAVLVAAAPAFVYFVFPSISLDHPWFLRRHAPVLLPVLAAAAGAAVAHVWERTRPRGRREAGVAAALLAAALLAPNVVASAPLVLAQEHAELPEGLARLAALFEDAGVATDDVVLFRGEATRFAPAMSALHGYTALSDSEGRTLRGLREAARASPEARVWVVSLDAEPPARDAYFPPESWRPHGHVEMALTTLERAGIDHLELYTKRGGPRGYDDMSGNLAPLPPREFRVEDWSLTLHEVAEAEPWLSGFYANGLSFVDVGQWTAGPEGTLRAAAQSTMLRGVVSHANATATVTYLDDFADNRTLLLRSGTETTPIATLEGSASEQLRSATVPLDLRTGERLVVPLGVALRNITFEEGPP